MTDTFGDGKGLGAALMGVLMDSISCLEPGFEGKGKSFVAHKPIADQTERLYRNCFCAVRRKTP